ncbi:hypothetical protein GCU67_10090 [Modestobacter muralis]|uniref:PKD domain-containing protein n=1 Tax=Modestobacter muralis TaxID=1608614 RepID=A0A6P0H6J6_9ACTN|nr:hypothetical protein [Modestobacter muralis]NEN51407.1 hypothetical protein [Modestobacter muralis]
MAWATAPAIADCRGLSCTPETGLSGGAVNLTAGDIVGPDESGNYSAQRAVATGPVLYTWRLRTPCEVDDLALGGCQPGGETCPVAEGRVITYYVVQRQRLVQPGAQPEDAPPPPPDAEVGSAYGAWLPFATACVDITDLNPPPSPDEVFRYFQTLPLPQLTTRQQPPGEALVGLPVIFFTDSPTTQVFTVDIRGFAVTITARATSFAWTTGDGTTLITTDAGAPYPDQTITHDYAAGTYTAGLTTTWGGTFSVDGGAAADVPGTTTTDGAPATFTVREARAVLTNPYD